MSIPRWILLGIAILGLSGQAIGNGSNIPFHDGSVTLVAGAATITYPVPFPTGTTVIVLLSAIGAAPQNLGVPDEVHLTATPTNTGVSIAASSTSDTRVVEYHAFPAQ